MTETKIIIDKKERQKEYFKNFQLKNKGKRVLCECDTEVAYFNLCNHKKTPKHAKRMIKKETI